MGTEKNEDTLKHYGVLGMHWGTRKGGTRHGPVSKRVLKISNGLKQRIRSHNRERHWKKVMKEARNMSTKDITKNATRLKLENEFKKHSKNKSISTKKDREDYRRREDMSHEELTRKVNRLKAKESLSKAVSDTTKSQRELRKKLFDKAYKVGKPIVIKYAKDKKLTPEDLIKNILNARK